MFAFQGAPLHFSQLERDDKASIPLIEKRRDGKADTAKYVADQKSLPLFSVWGKGTYLENQIAAFSAARRSKTQPQEDQGQKEAILEGGFLEWSRRALESLYITEPVDVDNDCPTLSELPAEVFMGAPKENITMHEGTEAVTYRPSPGTTYADRMKVWQPNLDPAIQSVQCAHGSSCSSCPGITGATSSSPSEGASECEQSLAIRRCSRLSGILPQESCYSERMKIWASELPNPSLVSIEHDSSGSNSLPGGLGFDDWLDTAVNQLKADVVRQVITQILSGTTQAVEGTDPRQESSAGPNRGNVASEKSGTGFAQRRSNGKRDRGRSRRDQEDEDESDSNGDDKRKRRRSKCPRDFTPAKQRLKCPYYQRRPEECTVGSCRGQGFTEMAKLKDHLKRVHTRPLQCPRCWKDMPSQEACDLHLRQREDCEVRPEPNDRRISLRKLQTLNFNRAPFAKKTSVEEKWSILYHILFPDEKETPSPYEQYGISSQFERFLILALQEAIAGELGQLIGDILDVIRERLPRIVGDCKRKAYDQCRESEDVSSDLPDTVISSSSGVDSAFDQPDTHQTLSGLGIGPCSDATQSELNSMASTIGQSEKSSQFMASDITSCIDEPSSVSGFDSWVDDKMTNERFSSLDMLAGIPPSQYFGISSKAPIPMSDTDNAFLPLTAFETAPINSRTTYDNFVFENY